MNPSKVENTDNTSENTRQSGNSKSTPSSPKQFFERFLKSYLLFGPDENVLTNLTCVNTVCLLFVFWFVFITSLLYTPLVRDKIEHGLNGCRKNPGGNWISDCESIESITNRIGFTLAGTFIILAGVSLFTPPGRVHQGFWLAKFLLLLILLSTSLMIPVGWFDLVWSIVCFLGSLVFYCIETVFILDFATTVSDVFVIKITEEHSRFWYAIWLVLVWMIYVIAVVSTVVLYGVYTDHCGLGLILVTTVFILCILFTLLAVYFSEKRTGFLHSGLCILFILLLTWVTLNHDGFCHDKISTTKLESQTKLSDEILKHLEIVIGFLVLMYAALRNYNEKYYYIAGLTISRHLVARDGSIETESLNSQREIDAPVFNTSAFFIMFGVFALFTTSKLTSLRTTKYSEPIIDGSTTFHLGSLTILVILVLMIWSQIFPLVYRNENPFDLLALGKTFFKSMLKLCRRILIDGCGCCNGPVASRYIFTVLYILGVLFSCLLYIPEIRHTLSKSTYFCATISTRGVCLSTDPAYMAVYRVCFAMATFYLLFAVILFRVDNTGDPRMDNTYDTRVNHTQPPRVNNTNGSRANNTEDPRVGNTQDPRVDLQYKAWPVKICLFCSLLLASFLLPNEFSQVWIYTALIGTFLFTILQLILLIYWTKTTTTNLQERIESSNTRVWSTFLILMTILMIFLSLAAVVTFYVFFTKFSRCLTNTVFITLNFALIVTASLISVHPKIYDAGLFQCYVIVIFSLYLTWCGLSHNPDEECNPVAGYIAEVDMRPNLNIQAGLDLVFTFLTVIYFSSNAPNISESIRSAYNSFRNICDCSRHKYESKQSAEDYLRKREAIIPDREMKSQSELYYPTYNFTLFHGVYLLASLHATVTLTNWFIPTTGSRFKLSVNWAAMCVKMTSSNLSLVTYVWIIAARLFTK